MHRVRTGLLLLLLTALFLTGCGSGRSGAELTWLSNMPEQEQLLQSLADKYRAKTGTEVTVVSVAPAIYDTALKTELKRSAAPAIFMLNAGNQETWADYCADLRHTPLQGGLSMEAYNLYGGDGALLAIGSLRRCRGIAVAPSLLEKAGHSLMEIEDLDSLRRVAEDIHARADILGFDAFARLELGDNAWRCTRVMAGAAITGSRSHWSGQLRSIFDLAAENGSTRFQRIADPGTDPAAEFRAGKAVFLFSDSEEYAALAQSVPDCTMLPCYCGAVGEERTGLSCLLGDGFAINARTTDKQQKAAAEFLLWLCTDKEAAALGEIWGFLPFTDAHPTNNAFLREAALLTAAGRESLPWLEPSTENVTSRDTLAAALQLYCVDRTPEGWTPAGLALEELAPKG